MAKFPYLQKGDTVEIIAPASRCTDQQLLQLTELLREWELNYVIDEHIFGDDLLCANSDEYRLNSLQKALQNPCSHAIVCARGGYGSMRLIPKLYEFVPPQQAKLFIGMSDVTALHLYLQQNWQWPTLHAAIAKQRFSPDSLSAIKQLIFAENPCYRIIGKPLNDSACETKQLNAVVTGGNLCLIQSSLGTSWQINAKNKILFIEEVGERGYRVDRMLEQLRQANIFQDIKAIVFGDFINGQEANGICLVNPVLQRFAQSSDQPVIKVSGIGHGYRNYPLPLGTDATLSLDSDSSVLAFKR